MGNDYLYMKSDIRYKVKAYDFEYGMHFRIHLKTKLLYINCNICPLKKDTIFAALEIIGLVINVSVLHLMHSECNTDVS